MCDNCQCPKCSVQKIQPITVSIGGVTVTEEIEAAIKGAREARQWPKPREPRRLSEDVLASVMSCNTFTDLLYSPSASVRKWAASQLDVDPPTKGEAQSFWLRHSNFPWPD